MVTTWTDDPLSKNVPCKAQHINELRAAIKAVHGIYTPPWGFGGRVSSSAIIKAQHLLDIRTAIGPGGGPGRVWNVRGANAGPMLWNHTVPGATTTLNGVLRVTHVDDLRRWFNTSETGAGSYQFPPVRPMLFGMNPSWEEWQNKPASYTNDAMMAEIRDAGGTCIRAGIDWNCIEPHPPVNGVHTYYWNARSAPNPCSQARNYDADVQLAQKYGLLYVADVGNAPNWATGNTSGLVPPDSAHTTDFQAFITAMAQHYLGQIRHYEFNNEPDQSGAWHNPSPDASSYVPFLLTFYNTIKAVDPAAWVSSGGVANLNRGNSGRPFVTGIYVHGGRGYFDAMAAHPYATPDVDTTGIAWLRSTMDGNGDTYKPIWLTEYGWNVNQVGEQNQATYLQDSLNDFAAAASITIATFQIIADIPASKTNMGLTDQALNPRQAYSTFASYVKPTT